MLDVINFHVYIQCQLLSQMHFPKRQLPRGIFPNDNFRSGNFPPEQFSKQQLPKSCLATVLSPLATALSAHCSLSAPQKALPNPWKVFAWEITHLGSCPFGNCHLGKYPTPITFFVKAKYLQALQALFKCVLEVS